MSIGNEIDTLAPKSGASHKI